LPISTSANRVTGRRSRSSINRAIAVAELEGPEEALALLNGLDLADYRYYHSTRADLLRRLGRDDEARAAYVRALDLTQAGPEQRFLEGRLTDLFEGAEHGAEHADS
jgi:RNA polymerase sigma-70 factor (ECF subfamily)